MTLLVPGLVVFLGMAAALWWVRANLTAVTVIGRSMEPALRHGDRVLVRRTPLDSIRRGQIVVLRPPGVADPAEWAIKRAVALPGDPMPAEPTVGDDRVPAGGGPRRVPAGHLVVLGDNRAVSHDSRAFGPVPANLVLGVVRGGAGHSGLRPDVRPDGAPTSVGAYLETERNVP